MNRGLQAGDLLLVYTIGQQKLLHDALLIHAQGVHDEGGGNAGSILAIGTVLQHRAIRLQQQIAPFAAKAPS